jgi:hypothetical protein
VTTVKFAHDDNSLYVRLEFKEGSLPNTGMDADTATKVSLILNDSAVSEGVRAGCWATCHEDAAGMPAGGAADRSKYLGKDARQAVPERRG